MDTEQRAGLLAPTEEHIAQVKVFPLIPALRKDVTNTIDSALTWDQLTAADINFTIVRPLVNKYARLRNMAVVYACLVVRQYFLAESESELAFAGVMLSRADLCELLAVKLLNRFATHYIQTIAVLTTSWSPLAGAPQQVVETVKMALNVDDDDIDSAHSAVEMAVQTQAKAFLAAPLTQKVVTDIYAGRVVFSAVANRSLLADNYKTRTIEIYDAKRKPFLDHYRLRVPKYGAYLEFINFALLLLTLVLALSNQDKAHLTFWEVAFIVFASAFALEEYTQSTGNGWIMYIANIWNAFDFGLIVIFLVYLGLRMKGLSDGDEALSSLSFDVLSCAACILFPRLAFFAVSDNVVILSLRAMTSQFVFFIGIAAICFSGLLFTLWTLASDTQADHGGHQWSLPSIAWLMVQIWFGNTYLSFAQASSFHPLFGPILMTVFAALSNTLLLTILISILSNTVARIDANATQEYLYQFTVSTIEGVKSDALFSYQPPFNVLAFAILKPASWFLTPRSLHSLNVFLIKVTSLPQLVVIGLYERYLADGSRFRESSADLAQTIFNSLPKHIKNMPLVEALVGSTSNDLFEAIFDVDMASEYDPFEEFDDVEDVLALRSHHSRETLGGRDTTANEGKVSERRRPRRLDTPIQTPAPGSPASVRVSLNEASPIDPTVGVGAPSGTQTPQRRTFATPSMPSSPTVARSQSRSRPRPRVQSTLSPMDAANMLSPDVLSSTSSGRSPLARLFTGRFANASTEHVHTHHNQSPNVPQGAAIGQVEAGIRRIEALLEDVSELPVQKLKEEMKELQDRQARIENLLLMLTRGMRNETPHTPHPSRQGTT